ncbi:Non-reducing end alpha-L-arabinofuranosidase [Bertholletia excelsa]
MNTHKPLLNLLCITITTTLFGLFLVGAQSPRPPYACDKSVPSTRSYPFCKTTLSVSNRACDLVSRLTVQEKISLLATTNVAIPLLGISKYEWWSEALHGIARVGHGVNFDSKIRSRHQLPTGHPQCRQLQLWPLALHGLFDFSGVHLEGKIPTATSFPQVIISNATFDPHLWYHIGQARGKEARAMYNEGQAQGITDPRRGRGQETPGECPILIGKYVGGKLKDDHFQASACYKHFTTFDLEGWNGTNRYIFDAIISQVSKQRLADTYQPPFQDCIEKAKPSGIMCAYNRVIGVPNCADYNLLTKTGRQDWGFQGYITSDCDAVAEHQDWALEAARDGIVLLKNSDNLLPLSKSQTLSLAVIGPNANAAQTLLGNYEGPPCESISPLTLFFQSIQIMFIYSKICLALKEHVKNTAYHSGSNFVNCTNADTDKAVEVAKSADYVVMFMGLDQTEEGEAQDREYLGLPGMQEELIEAVAKAAKRPIVLVLLCGGPVDVSFAKEYPKIGSMLWAGYPGEYGAIAIADIIFGLHNPGGKLPITWYPREFEKVPMTDMRMRADPSSGYPGGTYSFYTGKKVFEFEHGLSYSKYPYEFISVTQHKLRLSQLLGTMEVKDSDSVRHLSVSEVGKGLCENAKFSVVVGVKNQGDVEGKHPVLLFVRQEKQRDGSPMKQFIGFDSVQLKAGERAEIEYVLNPCEHLSRANEDGLMVIEEGSRQLMVGGEEYMISIEV